MTENQFDTEFPKYENLSVKIFSDLCCSNCVCQNESAGIEITDNMGRKIFWEDN